MHERHEIVPNTVMCLYIFLRVVFRLPEESIILKVTVGIYLVRKEYSKVYYKITKTKGRHT